MNISLRQIYVLVRKNFLLILVCAFLGFAGAFSISKFAIQKTYVSTVKLYVSSSQTSSNSTFDINELNYAQKVVNTYMQMLQTNNFYQKVIDESKLSYTINNFEKMIKFSSLNDTEVFQVQVSAHDPNEAKTIADAVTVLAPVTIGQLKDSASIKVVDSATLPSQPSSPNVMAYSIIGFLFGVMCSVVFALLHDILDVKIKSEDDLLEKYNIPVLASIPAFTTQFSRVKKHQSGKKFLKGKKPVTEIAVIE